MVMSLMALATSGGGFDLGLFFGKVDPNQVALGALVTFMVVGLLRGWVVPRSVLLDRMADKDKQIALLTKEKDDWKSAYNTSEQGRIELGKQNTALIEGGETTNRLMESLRNRLEHP